MVWNFNYWKRLGVKGPRPRVLFGNFPNQFARKKHMAYDLRNIYEYVVTVRRLKALFIPNSFDIPSHLFASFRSYKNTENFVGIYSCRRPQLMIINAELIQRAYVGDFKHFHDNDMSLFVST